MLRKVFFIFFLSLVFFFSSLYFKENENAKKAQILIDRLKDYCEEESSLPSKEKFQKLLIELNIEKSLEWYYFEQKDRKSFYLQYPVHFWSRRAIGKPKLSEFFPVPYSYLIKVNCLE